MQAYRVVLADDQPALRQILKKILSAHQQMKVVGEAGNGIALLQLLNASHSLPDLVILDITMPEMHGIDAAREIRTRFPSVKILILTVHAETEYISQAFTAGAAGYLLKDEADTELFKAIRAIRRGGTYRSPRVQSAVA